MSGLPSGWVRATLESLRSNHVFSMVDGPYGSNLKTDDYVDQGARVVRLGNIGVGKFVDRVKAYVSAEKFAQLIKHRVVAGDLLIAALAEPVGRACVAPSDLGDAIVKADCIKMTVHEEIPTKYVMNWLNSPAGQAQTEERSRGIGRLRINLANLRAAPVPVAPLEEQKRMVDRLNRLEVHREVAKESLDAIPPLLEKFRQSVLAAAFRGDLTADWRRQNPDVEPASVLLERIRAERRQRWEDAELAKMRAKGKEPKDDKWRSKYQEPSVAPDSLLGLPDGWYWSSLDFAGDWSSGGTPARGIAEFYGGDIPWVKTGDLNDGRIEEVPESLTQAGIENSSAKLFPPGTLLIAMYGATIGKLGMLGFEAATNQACAALLPSESSSMCRDYLFFWLLRMRPELRKLGQGGAQPNISQGILRGLCVPVPSPEEQALIVERIKEQFDMIERIVEVLEFSKARLSTLSQSILAKAFRGELVPQDPNDEPASVLLERIRAERAASPPTRKRKTRA